MVEGRNFSSWAQKCIFSTRIWKIGRLRASNHRDNAGLRWKADLFFHYGFCGGFCLFSQIAGVNLLMALKLPGQVYDEGNFFPKEEPWDATFGLDPKRWSVSGWKASQILPVIYVVRDLEFINVYNLFEPSIQRSILIESRTNLLVLTTKLFSQYTGPYPKKLILSQTNLMSHNIYY